MKIKIGWIIFVVLIVYFIFLIRSDVIRLVGLKKQEATLKDNIQMELDRALQLKLRQDRIKTGEAVEHLARKKLGMIKKGETVYKILKP